METYQAKKNKADVKWTFNNLFSSHSQKYSVDSLKKRHVSCAAETTFPWTFNFFFSKPLTASKGKN